MTLPSYQLDVYDPNNGRIIQIFDQYAFYELEFERLLNDVGKLAATLPWDRTRLVSSAFPLDALIDVKRTDPSTGDLVVEETYLARLTHRFRTDDGAEALAIGGLSLNHLLMRRVIDPADDPLAAGGYSTKAGNADIMMRDYCREQLGDLASIARRIPHLAIAAITGTGTAIGARMRYENLLESMKGWARGGLVDFVIEHVSGYDLVLNLAPIGSDKTKTTNYPNNPWVGFEPERGNLADPELIVDRKEEGTVVYMMGEGNRTNRDVLIVTGDHVADSPYNRIEFTSEGRTTDKSSPTELLTLADAAIREKQVFTEFKFRPVESAAGSTYRLDWNLGDRVTAMWSNFEKDVRVTGVKFSVSENGEALDVTLEDVV